MIVWSNVVTVLSFKVIVLWVFFNRGELKRFLRTTPRITQLPLVVLTVMCQNSCHQYLLTPAPFLPLREHRWDELCACVMVP